MGLLLIELDYGSFISRIACRCRTRRLSTAVCVVYDYRQISESFVNCAGKHTRLSFIKSIESFHSSAKCVGCWLIA